eukprot:CAMPEP_0174250166 /NCGR_PEP_ID=MMETSP0439-20130205/421_1 /TAXON_ID=0 /ORGANISM="Stereomyxa ramosa, Strain Chinc5" /LENGTH=359 /DNA_ID=CAMNT_0015330161 /DNA_START=56 /DNA_END=1132 /DNA_ORIENTATION=+
MAYGIKELKDPLDTVMGVVGVYVIMVIVCMWYGYIISPIVVTLVLFFVLRSLTHKNKKGVSGWGKWNTAEEVSEGIDMTGKVVFITGPTSGIGEHTAQTLALRGAEVIMGARSKQKLEESERKIKEYCKRKGVEGNVRSIGLDLSSLDSVRLAAQQFLDLGLPLDVLICNAGVMAVPEGKTKDGFETQVGINHLGHFLLVSLLINKLEERKGRVVVLTSSAHRMGSEDFFESSNSMLDTIPYSPWRAYGNSKLCNMMFAFELHKRYHDRSVTAVCVHPGGIFTGLQWNVGWYITLKWKVVSPFFFKSIEQGAATTVICATAPKVEGGKFYEDANPSRPYLPVRSLAEDPDKCAWLFETS